MKLSEMKTRDAAHALCQLTPYIGEIGKDEAVNTLLFELSKNREQHTMFEYVTEIACAFIPALLDRHYTATLSILSILSGKGLDDLEEQNIVDTMQDAVSIIDDKLISFFSASVVK